MENHIKLHSRLPKLLAFATMLFSFAMPTLAEDKVSEWAHKDWSVISTETNTGEDLRIQCDLYDKSGNLMRFGISQSNGDVGPPDVYPSISLVRTLGEDGQPMAIADEDLNFTFTFDEQTPMPLQMTWAYSNRQNVFAVPSSQNQFLLREMAKGHTLSLQTNIFGELHFSLAGFSAAYRKMADRCSFTVEGVLNTP